MKLPSTVHGLLSASSKLTFFLPLRQKAFISKITMFPPSPSAASCMVSHRPWRYMVAALETVCQVSMVTNKRLLKWWTRLEQTAYTCTPPATSRVKENIALCQCQKEIKFTSGACTQSKMHSSTWKEKKLNFVQCHLRCSLVVLVPCPQRKL